MVSFDPFVINHARAISFGQTACMLIQFNHMPYADDAKVNSSVYLGLKHQEVSGGGGGCDVGVRRTHHLFSRAPKRIWKEGRKERGEGGKEGIER